ncbi:MAG TPA: lytic transglycosylase domain-containing protein [Kiritimatiellia bacterium]|nr:lytic transglycosylase domain-containing protein [Kiritimatiellia bacterium]HRZ11624.1 lytic transglycosylase domain-containing protein [Kiritimatiellia bacterium]HSA16825.1 lytic transglycosylase domain-containing protein [Kiritimatiellia bacterium]
MLIPALAWPLAASAQLPDDLLEQAVQAGEQLAREHLPADLLDQYEWPSPETWTEFWTGLTQTLETGSLDDLAWLKPAAESAIEMLRMVPEGASYADWLQQRMDYFDMAEALVREVPAPGQPPPPPPPARRGELKTPPRPKPAPPPPAVQQRRMESARSTSKWETKLSGRPAPARAAALAPRLKDIFRAEGVPPELIWLAEVESSFNPEARSPVGAAGLFQFMPATAQRFGLSVKPKDERLAPEKSAGAAAKYLRYLHGMFHSWPLAFAAYNAGEGRVGKLLKSAPARTFEAIQDRLPTETQMYVPKVLATIKLRERVDLSAPASSKSP